ncbi:MAG: glycosyltransferase [Proteiniphilum sp.]|uniref:glycosyltransferase n=1 Tax=Proteiniphilum sp. TaxID=1926877 RepID=UPI002ABCD537|nr:glycosyltransferase [Proteiniphilum sp.]MDY9918632.1 glycosyltransferase [Proteiniphilum sp.]
MKYLICQEWINTKTNHAGIKHMCQLLIKKYPTEYEVIISKDYLGMINKKILWGKVIARFYILVIHPCIDFFTAFFIYKKLNSGDTVYLLEYCTPYYSQTIIAKFLRKRTNKKKSFTINGMLHLVPDDFMKHYSAEIFKSYIDLLDNVITLGSSLTHFLENTIHINQRRIKTTLHYVDSTYYKPNTSGQHNDILRIIVMGNMKRDYTLLKEIIANATTDVTFLICQGTKDLSMLFQNMNNVKLYGFLNEDDLLHLMQSSDISLNVMQDTIGSNVIVTSMAVGLAMINSDVGSIRDYCNEDGALYCDNKNPKSFSDAINYLYENREKLNELKSKSLYYSKSFSIDKIHL